MHVQCDTLKWSTLVMSSNCCGAAAAAAAAEAAEFGQQGQPPDAPMDPDAPPGAAPAADAPAAGGDAAPADNPAAGHAAAVAAAANAAAANAAGMFPVPPLNFHVHVPPPPGMQNANAQQRGRRNETANEYCALFVALIGEGKDPQVRLAVVILCATIEVPCLQALFPRAEVG